MMTAAVQAGLDGVCVTEHNRIWKPSEARVLAEKYGLTVFRGMEVTTTAGDVLVMGLEEEPRSLWTPEELKERVDSAGGIAIAAHPFRGFLVFGFSTLRMDLNDALDNRLFANVHGMEVCNSLVTDDENEFAGQVADALGLAKVGGSDAHRPKSVGACVNVFEDWIRDERDLIQAVLKGHFRVERRKYKG
jgi:predicted metal-dependent phosphoesterase TrpH